MKQRVKEEKKLKENTGSWIEKDIHKRNIEKMGSYPVIYQKIYHDIKPSQKRKKKRYEERTPWKQTGVLANCQSPCKLPLFASLLPTSWVIGVPRASEREPSAVTNIYNLKKK